MTVRTSGLRADAARNREQILHAAHEAFSSDGLEVSMAEIARRAGVGFATAQRRFPTKEDLVRAIFLEELSALRTATERAAAVGDDPWEAFAAPIRVCAAHQAEHPGLSGMIVGMVDAAAASENTIASFFAEIADQAVRVGILRAGVTLNDVLAILKGNSGVIALSPGSERAASERFVELALQGLRAA